MRRNSQHIIIGIAATVAGSTLAVTLAPAGTASAATVVSQSSGARTAPGMPRFGETGPAVKALQEAIIRNGFTLRGGATGTFDSRTRSVLRTFQKVVGLKVTGVVDANTARVLKLANGSTTTSAPAAPSTTAAPTTVAPSTTAAPVAPAAPAPSFPFTAQNLPVRGNKGDAVVVVQKALAAAGLQVRGGIDGSFGSGTTATVAQFQTARGLAPSGLLDIATARALGLVAPETAPAPSPVAKAATAAPLTVATLPRRGQKSSAVVTVQQALVNAGITVKGGVDGVFGAATTIALRSYQSSNGIAVTGLADYPTALKLGLVEAPAVSIAVFPVQGACNFEDTWHAPRGNGRLHLGVDVIAPEGKLIYAVVDGTITKTYSSANDKLAGNGVRLTAADGTYFFYGHFQRVADGISVGTKVKAGQVIGYNGKSGATNTPHLHFEVHPRGGEAINPFPIVKAVDACHVTTPLPVPAP
jgi:peptidoglycan hydrolase-like protein with peptidoglycan-binding domain